jgi:hypothetical protein
MNSVMERWVRTRRRELPDRTLIRNQRHLLRAPREFEDVCSSDRPHHGIARPHHLTLTGRQANEQVDQHVPENLRDTAREDGHHSRNHVAWGDGRCT